MDRNAPAYGRGFDALLAVPLVGYLLLICGLIGAVFVVIAMQPGAVREAFSDPALLYAIKLSLLSSAVSTLLAIVVAVPAGYILSRHRFPGHFFLDTVLDLPIVLPPLVMGLCVLIMFNLGDKTQAWLLAKIGYSVSWRLSDPFIYQPLGIVLVQFVVGCAFAVRVVKAGFDALNPQFEEVAMTLGANRRQAFFKVVIPNIAPSLVAGAVITWSRIFGLFGPILLVAGTMRFRTEIMPTTIFLETSIGRIEVALVVGAFMILISMTTLLIFKRLGGKGYLW